MHPTDIQSLTDDLSSVSKLHEQMYLHDQALAYPSSLHISRAIDIKMVVDRVYPRLPVWDVSKKKGFEMYYKEQMPSWQMKVKIVNHPYN